MSSIYYYFFFSSRRRHTRCLSDWSSDVCSSDLSIRRPSVAPDRHGRRILHIPSGRDVRCRGVQPGGRILRERHLDGDDRSEERRVGKECRTQWAPDQEKKEVKEVCNYDTLHKVL